MLLAKLLYVVMRIHNSKGKENNQSVRYIKLADQTISQPSVGIRSLWLHLLMNKSKCTLSKILLNGQLQIKESSNDFKDKKIGSY